MRILVVEDDTRMAESLAEGLREATYETDLASCGEQALELAGREPYDLILLDVMLPDIDGFEVTRRLRGRGHGEPILMLTARDGVDDRVDGLDVGADDYLVKPFAFAELLARIRALLRRKSGPSPAVLTFDDLALDPTTHQATRENTALDLSAKEFALLEFFLRNPGRVLTRTVIADHAWDYNFDPQSNVVDVYISRLRTKVESGGASRLIQTVRGVGYVLRVP